MWHAAQELKEEANLFVMQLISCEVLFTLQQICLPCMKKCMLKVCIIQSPYFVCVSKYYFHRYTIIVYNYMYVTVIDNLLYASPVCTRVAMELPVDG